MNRIFEEMEKAGITQVFDADEDAKHPSTAPCSIACPKCGCDDINRHWHEEGDIWKKPYGDRHEKATDHVHWRRFDIEAVKECIVHHCCTCQYEWTTGPIGD